MNRVKVLIAGAAVTGSILVGGVVGTALFSATTISAAAATTPTPAAATSNEAAAHEKGETAAHETAENNGTAHLRGGPGHGPNEDPTHEAAETAAHEAAENARKAPAITTSATPAA